MSIQSQLGALEARINAQAEQIIRQNEKIRDLEHEVHTLHHLRPSGSFYLFGKLPLEIRNLVWKFALPGLRIVELSVEYGAGIPGVREVSLRFPNDCIPGNVVYEGRLKDADSNWVPPVLLFTCRESRKVAVESYETCLALTPIETSVTRDIFRRKKIPNSEITSPGIRFQPASDTVYIPKLAPPKRGPATILVDSTPPQFRFGNIKSIALDGAILNATSKWERCFKNTFEYVGDNPLLPSGWEETGSPWFTGVEEIIVVADEGDLEELKSSFERRIREESSLSQNLDIVVLSKEKFKAMPRWRS